MLRKESEAVPEGNGTIPQQVGSGQPTLEDVYRRIEELLERWWMAKHMRLKDQHEAGLEQDAWQLRLAMVADGQADIKTRERTEDAATTVQTIHGDRFSASRVDPGPKTNSSSFGVKAGSPAFPCRDDVVVENGTATRRPTYFSHF